MNGEGQNRLDYAKERYPPVNRNWGANPTKIEMPKPVQVGSSRTSNLNRLAGLSGFQTQNSHTVAPMKRDSQLAANTIPHPKRARTSLNEKLQANSSKPSGSRQSSFSITDTTRPDLEKKISGESSDDELNLPRTDVGWRPHKSDSMLTQNEPQAAISKIPHYDMKEMKTARPMRRITAMKTRDGKTKQDVQKTKPDIQKKKPQDITGANDVFRHRTLITRPSDAFSESSSWEEMPLNRIFYGYEDIDIRRNMCLRWSHDKQSIEIGSGPKELVINQSGLSWLVFEGKYLVVGLDRKMVKHWDPQLISGAVDYIPSCVTLGLQDDVESNKSLEKFLRPIKQRYHPPHDWSSMENHLNTLQNIYESSFQTPSMEPSALPSPVDEVVDLPKSPKKSPKKNTEASSKPSNIRSTRSSNRALAPNANLDDDEITLIYPFVGTGGVQITKGDERRLSPGEFLNDSLIEFGLRYWLDTLKKTDPGLAEQIHIFSPFFYKKLKTKDIEAGYKAVSKWTSKVDIFRKRYLVVPINERAHWYFAIIMYPGNMLNHQNYVPAKPPPKKISTRSSEPTDILNSPLSSISSLSPPAVIQDHPDTYKQNNTLLDNGKGRAVSPIITDPDEEVDELANDDDLQRMNSPGIEEGELLASHRESSATPDESWKAMQDSTWLLTFDSLGGGHPSVPKTLQSYLIREVKNKRGIDVDSTLPILRKKVPAPVQPNWCDCGVYVIKTVETFLSKPDAFFQRLMDENDSLTEDYPLWDKPSFSTKREELLSIISDLSKQWKELKEAKTAPLPEALPPKTKTQPPSIDVDTLEDHKGKGKAKEQTPDEDNDVEILGVVSKNRRNAGKQRSNL